MSTLELENIKHPDNSGDNIALASNGSITIDRQSTDGTIAEFRKDGTAVGSIGATSGNSYIVNSTNGGIRLGNEYGRAVLEPCNESGTPEDNLHFIGSSTNRWRDLYLSGGVYLGGTGAANHLDDYEEGTWTPTLGGNAVYDIQAGRYRKVGAMVFIYLEIRPTTLGTGSTTQISGLPFSAGSSSNGINPAYYNGAATNIYTLDGIIQATSISLYGRTSASNAASQTPAFFQNNARLYMTATYEVAS